MFRSIQSPLLLWSKFSPVLSKPPHKNPSTFEQDKKKHSCRSFQIKSKQIYSFAQPKVNQIHAEPKEIKEKNRCRAEGRKK